MTGLDGQFGPRARLHVARRHVVVRVRPVATGVQVEQGKRIEIGDDRPAGPVLVEDGQEGKFTTDVGGQLPRDEPGIGLAVWVITLGGREAELRVSWHQVEGIRTPVSGERVVHGTCLFCYVYSNSNFSGLDGR
jgi:hypothetical protein